jgi:hypothetical protein
MLVTGPPVVVPWQGKLSPEGSRGSFGAEAGIGDGTWIWKWALTDANREEAAKAEMKTRENIVSENGICEEPRGRTAAMPDSGRIRYGFRRIEMDKKSRF